jgi:GTP-binding protein EngB required for normal cell division
MNDNHRRHLVSILRHIDELLDETVAKLGPLEAARLFPSFIPDAAPIQRKVIADYARRIREAMAAALSRFGVAVAPPAVSGVWSARTNLMGAQIALAELAPRTLRGYGALTEEDERDLRATVSELSELLDQMESYLAQGPAEDLHTRLQRVATPHADGALLLELERIVSAHGLVQFRPALERLAEQLESGALEVAVFGRVNSGKSSLLNDLLKTNALPVGVTPVTAIPVRIVHGQAARGQVWFVDAETQVFDLDRLAEFVSEQQNPANARHVTRLTVEIPSPLLEEGVVFVDTPGLGSVRTGGTAETWAYLPRCDLGLVLIDAASTLTEADVELVDALRHAGAEAMVLLSKADILEGQDLQRALGFIQQELSDKLGTGIPVYPVSVRGAARALTEHWLETVLMPRLRDHQALFRQALARKIGLLHDAVRTALAQRLGEAKDETARGIDAVNEALSNEIDHLLAQALARLDAARNEPPAEIGQLAGLAHAALDEAAHNAAVIWHEHPENDFDATSLIESSVQSRAGVAAGSVARQLADLRVFLRATLDEVHGKAPASLGSNWPAGEELPRPAGMPLLDGAGTIPRTVLRRPAFAFAGIAALKHGILKQLQSAGLEQRVASAYANYGRQLEKWRQAMLAELRRGFLAQRELLPKPATPAADPETADAKTDASATLLADLQRLDGNPP